MTTPLDGRFAGLLAGLLLSAAWAGPARADRGHGDRPIVVLAGDSNMVGWFGRFLSDSLQDAGFRVIRRAKAGSGLAYPSYWDWLTVAPALAERYSADAVVLILGGNDGQSIKPRTGDRWSPRVSWREPSSWREEYANRLVELAQRVARGKRRLIVLSPTNRRPRIDSRKVKRIRDVQRAALTGLDGVWWVDTYRLSSDHDGRYLAEGENDRGQRVRFRRGDGIHLTRAGAAALRDKVLPVLLRSGLRGLGPLRGSSILREPDQHW